MIENFFQNQFQKNKPLLSRSSSSSSVGSSQGNINSTNFNTNLSINQSSSFAQESPQTCSGKFIHFLKYCGRHSPMTTEQKLRLDWWTKWRKYGRFPWKFLFDVLMTIFATVLVNKRKKPKFKKKKRRTIA